MHSSTHRAGQDSAELALASSTLPFTLILALHHHHNTPHSPPPNRLHSPVCTRPLFAALLFFLKAPRGTWSAQYLKQAVFSLNCRPLRSKRVASHRCESHWDLPTFAARGHLLRRLGETKAEPGLAQGSSTATNLALTIATCFSSPPPALLQHSLSIRQSSWGHSQSLFPFCPPPLWSPDRRTSPETVSVAPFSAVSATCIRSSARAP